MSTADPSRGARSSEFFFARAGERLSRAPFQGMDVFIEASLNPDWPSQPPKEMVFRDAGILVPIVERYPEASVILTERTSHLPQHGGQIAFPGGKVDPADGGPEAAAMREAEEEIGLEPGLVAPIGFLDTYVTHTGFRLFPLVARVREPRQLAPNPLEVAMVFEVPLSFLMDPRNHLLGSRIFQGRSRHFYEMSYDGHRIWGITASIIRMLYEKIYF